MAERNERRSYFRLDDVLMLHYRVITADDDGAGPLRPASRGTAPQVSTSGILAQIEREFGESLRRLWQSQPETAQALGLLNRKLSVIARSFDAVPDPLPAYEEARVNISGSGIAFETQEALASGTPLHLQLMLLPSQEELQLTGRVVRCDALPPQEDGERWLLRVDFDESPDEQERLVQHIIQLQSIRLSARRQQS